MQQQGFLCNKEKVRLREYTFRLDPTADYINSHFIMHFWDGENLDIKMGDLDFVPDSLVEPLVRLVDWLEGWRGMQVFKYRIQNMSTDTWEFDCTITARSDPQSRIGRFYVPSTELPEDIRTIMLRLWRDMQASYGIRYSGIYVPLGTQAPTDTEIAALD